MSLKTLALVSGAAGEPDARRGYFWMAGALAKGMGLLRTSRISTR
jgi:hypothetical protein